jgi:DNA adenine methylase
MATAAKKKIRPPAKYYGGKAYLARRIISLLPADDQFVKFCEPCGGLASVMLNLIPPTREHPRVEVYNDLHFELYNLFHCLRIFGEDLLVAIQLTPYSEAEFKQHYALPMGSGNKAQRVERARQTISRLQMSFGGQGKSFSQTKLRTRRGIADVVSGYLSTIHDELPAIIARVMEWQITCVPVLPCIGYHDSPRTCFYVDPPYLPDTRTSPAVYAMEMTREDHETLLDTILGCEGMFAISHYRHKLYDDKLKDWNRHDFDMALHAAGGKVKARRTECLWMNY